MRKPGTLRKLHVKITPLTNTFRKRHLEEEQQLFVCLFTGRSRVSISGPETPTEWKSESVTNQPTMTEVGAGDAYASKKQLSNEVNKG